MGEVVSMPTFDELSVPERLLEIVIRQEDVAAWCQEKAATLLRIVKVKTPICARDIVCICVLSGGEKLYVSPERSYSEEWVNDLIGKRVGDIVPAIVDGEIVQGKIESVKRSVVPEWTDELVAQMGIAKVRTTDDLQVYARDQIVREQKQKRFRAIHQSMMKQLAEQAVYKDLDQYVSDLQNALTKKAIAASGESNAEKALRAFLRIPANAVVQEELDKLTKSAAKFSLVGLHWAKLSGKSWTESDYEAEIAQKAQSPEEREHLRKNLSFAGFCDKEAQSYLAESIRQYVDGKFRVTIAAK